VSALSPAERLSLEARVEAAHAARQPHRAVALLVEGYGPELLSFLAASLPDRDVAADVFSVACEDLLRTFSTFRHQCSYRTWVYALARTGQRA